MHTVKSKLKFIKLCNILHRENLEYYCLRVVLVLVQQLCLSETHKSIIGHWINVLSRKFFCILTSGFQDSGLVRRVHLAKQKNTALLPELHSARR